MASYALMDIAIILLVTKLLGVMTKKYRMTQVLGAVVAGILLGPAGLHVLKDELFIEKMAEIGVIIIIFLAGLETDLTKLKKSTKASFLIALFGVLLPLGGGILTASLFNTNVLENIFIGVILTTTSVSITVETLIELGKLKTETGMTILGAAVIDDILGILILTFVMGHYGNENVQISWEILKIIIFIVFAAISGIAFNHFFNWFSLKEGRKRRVPVLGFAFCLLLSYIAGRFGVPDIIGAYIAGLMISNTILSYYVESKVEVLTYMFFAPMHFAHIGMKTVLGTMEGNILIFTGLLLVVAIVTKIGGCTLGAKLSGFKNRNALQVGIGMVCRGEIALIIANRGSIMGILSETFFAPVIIVIIITTLMTPIFIRFTIPLEEKKTKNAQFMLSDEELDQIMDKYTNDDN